MSWFKVDDKLHTAPKLIKIPRKHRLAALGLWTIAGSWSADQETDGLIPDYMVEEWGGTKALVDWLVKADLWQKVEDGTQFKNWEEYQPTHAQKEAEREKNREKLRKWRERNQGSNQGVTGLHDGYTPVSNAAPDPTRPDPSLTEANASVKESMSDGASAADAGKQYGLEVHELCNYLAEWIVRNGNRRPTVGQQWLQACDRLIRLDGVSPQDVRGAIDWSQQNEFWRANILSMPKLREKYDQLRLAATRTTPQNPQQRTSTTQARLQTGQTMVERLEAKEAQREAAQQQELLQIGHTA